MTEKNVDQHIAEAVLTIDKLSIMWIAGRFLLSWALKQKSVKKDSRDHRPAQLD